MKTRSSPFLKLLPLVAAGFFVLAPAQKASAELIYLGLVDLGGQGVGGTNTILSLAPEANGTNACGSVTFGDVLTECPGIDTQFAAGGNNQTYTFGEIDNFDSAADLRLIFNINEPGLIGDVTLNELSAYFYLSDGTLYHTATYTGPPNLFPEAGSGIGGAGHVFGLDAEQQALVQAQFSLTNVLGLKASISNAAGGFESFNVGALGGDDVTPVPEPFTATLFGTGLLALAAVARRRRNASKAMAS